MPQAAISKGAKAKIAEEHIVADRTSANHLLTLML